VEAVERRAREHREHQATEPYFGLARCGKGEAVARHLVWLEGERVRLEARTRELLDDGEDVTEGCTDKR
jgi:hypothetical protein